MGVAVSPTKNVCHFLQAIGQEQQAASNGLASGPPQSRAPRGLGPGLRAGGPGLGRLPGDFEGAHGQSLARGSGAEAEVGGENLEGWSVCVSCSPVCCWLAFCLLGLFCFCVSSTIMWVCLGLCLCFFVFKVPFCLVFFVCLLLKLKGTPSCGCLASGRREGW